MGKLYLNFDQGVPRYVCTGCSSCSSVMGNSMCSIKNRGCCSYFPKYSLLDIQRMAKAEEGLQILSTIISHPGTVVYQYTIHTKGFFDKTGYEEYMRSGQQLFTEDVNDQTVFFRACPFVRSGHGCTIPPVYRDFICNMFICAEILTQPSSIEAMKPYIDERSSYAGWVEWENSTLQHILCKNKINLDTDFHGTIEVLQKTSLSVYEFPCFKPVNYTEDESNNISTPI